MTTSQTTNLHLTKAVKGTNEPFSIDAINANLDTIDSAVGAVGNTSLQAQIDKFKLIGQVATVGFDIWSTGFQVGVYFDSNMQNGFLVNVETSNSKIYGFTVTDGTPTRVFEK